MSFTAVRTLDSYRIKSHYYTCTVTILTTVDDNNDYCGNNYLCSYFRRNVIRN